MTRIAIDRADYGKPDALERAVDRASHKRAIESAVFAERERCAEIAVAAGALQHGPGSAIFKQFALDIADQIRTTE